MREGEKQIEERQEDCLNRFGMGKLRVGELLLYQERDVPRGR